jgi:hypothetical protein
LIDDFIIINITTLPHFSVDFEIFEIILSKFRLPKVERSKKKTKKARIPDSNKVGIIMVILAILRRYSFSLFR